METVYSKAADLIRADGWQQGSMGFEGGPRCIWGALMCFGAGVEVIDVVEAHLGGVFAPTLTRWNDAPERTVEDIFMVLKELHLEAGGS